MAQFIERYYAWDILLLLLDTSGRDIEVIHQRDTVTRLDDSYFIFDVTVEGGISNGQFFNVG